MTTAKSVRANLIVGVSWRLVVVDQIGALWQIRNFASEQWFYFRASTMTLGKLDIYLILVGDGGKHQYRIRSLTIHFSKTSPRSREAHTFF